MLTRTSKDGLQDSVLLSDAVTGDSNKDGEALLPRVYAQKGMGVGRMWWEAFRTLTGWSKGPNPSR